MPTTRISVKLDPETKKLSGKQRLTWRNTSPDTIGDLWFHLYLNAFRNSNSTFFRESNGMLRDDEMPEDGGRSAMQTATCRRRRLAAERDLGPPHHRVTIEDLA